MVDMSQPITVTVTINAPISSVWEKWNEPRHITHWAFAQDDWEAFDAENDLRVGGKFKTTLSAKDKSTRFDFGGTYTVIIDHELIKYVLADNRRIEVAFASSPDGVTIIETFDPETKNSREKQQQGWQAILNNFKKYVESHPDA
jgi:uncharacterized protein YndB with AHSA1/START domain